MLTPIDIQKRNFQTSFRGYNKKEVDEFMSMIAESLEKRISELEDTKARLREGEKELKKFKIIENTLSETLVFAKQTSEDLISSARDREEMIMREAELKVEEHMRERRIQIMALEENIEKLNFRYETLKLKIKNFLNMEIQLLDEEVPTIEGIKSKSGKVSGLETSSFHRRQDPREPEPVRAEIYKTVQQEEDIILPNLENITE